MAEGSGRSKTAALDAFGMARRSRRLPVSDEEDRNSFITRAKIPD
jgi:hypothetical protein